MTGILRTLPAFWLAPLLLLPLSSHGESMGASGGAAASASIQLSVVIPPSLRVLENRHPDTLAQASGGEHQADQRLVVSSTMKHGFCATLRLAAAGVRDWRLQVANPSQDVDAIGDGYRVCTRSAGRHTLDLRHRFATDLPGASGPMAWPVLTEITAL